MKYKNNLTLRVFSILLAALIALTSVDVSAFSAPNSTSSNETISQNLSVELESQVQDAYKALMKAYKSRKQSDFLTACKLIAKLSPTQSVRLYVLKYKDYYKQNYLKGDFAYFDVDKYLLAHPELINPQHSLSYNREKALEHYLDYGIYKGDSSCTEFDPIIAIIVQTEECIKAIVNDNNVPSLGLASLKEAYTIAEGTDSTVAYDLDSSFGESAEGKFIADNGILYVGKKNDTSVSRNVEIAAYEEILAVDTTEETTQNSTEDSYDGSQSVGGDEERDPFFDGGYGGPNNYELLINNNARKDIEGFKLYYSPQEIVSSNNLDAYLADNKKDLINFDLDYTKANRYKYDIDYIANNYLNIANNYAENPDYSKIKDNAKYTVMIYLCGTDLEAGYPEASILISEILKSKYDPSKVNVLICAGGTNTWGTDVLKENDGVKSTIYYLDPTKVSDSAIASSKDRNDIVNENSLIKLTQIKTPIEMGQSEFLLGFMDMAYELFPADNFWLSLWNHGGGAKRGICFSDSVDGNSEITSDGLSLAKIEEALASSKLYSDDRKLGIMSFDACMMAGVEEAYNLSRYADYMIGSAESAIGDFDYGETIKYVSDLPNGEAIDNREVAKVASIGYMRNKDNRYAIVQDTSAVFDLSKMDELNAKNEDLSLCLEALLRDDANAYKTIRKAAVRSKSYGASETSPTWGYLDYYDFLIKLQAYLQDLGNTSQVKFTKSRCEQAISDIDNIINTKFILNGNVSYGKQNDIIKVGKDAAPMSLKDVAIARDINADLIYNKIFDNYLSGMSIYFPIYDNGYQNLARYYDEPMKNYLDESILHHYAYMLREVNKTADSTTEIERLKKVATALAKNSNIKENGMLDGITTSSYTGAKAYEDGKYPTESIITVDFKKNYDTPYANDGIHNDPFTDFVDVVKDIKLISLKNTKSYSVIKDENGKDQFIYYDNDIIVGSKSVQTALAVSSAVEYKNNNIIENTKLNIDLAANNIIGYIVEGLSAVFDIDEDYHKNEYKVNDYDHYYRDWAHMIVGNDKSNYLIDYASLGDDYSDSNVYIFDGKYYYVQEDGLNVAKSGLLAFKKNTDAISYSYLGVLSGEPCEGVTNYRKNDNVKAISFDHYTVTEDGKIVKLEDIIEAINNTKTDEEKTYLRNPVYIIDATNTPTIKESVLAGMGYNEENQKIAIELNVYVTEDGEHYEEQSVVYTGNKELYLDSDENADAENHYKESEALGTEVDVSDSGSVSPEETEGEGAIPAAAPRCSEDELGDVNPVSGSQVGTPSSELNDNVDAILNDEDAYIEENDASLNDEDDEENEEDNEEAGEVSSNTIVDESVDETPDNNE